MVGLCLNTAHCLNTAGAAAVKPAAARGLASLLRACRRERQRTDLYCRIMRELAWGRSCFARLAFIQVCSGGSSLEALCVCTAQHTVYMHV